MLRSSELGYKLQTLCVCYISSSVQSWQLNCSKFEAFCVVRWYPFLVIFSQGNFNQKEVLERTLVYVL
jgi:hypothetical protein